MELTEDRGIHVGKEKDFAIDPSVKTSAGNILITHAHSDHVNMKSKSSYMMSKPTLDIINSNHGNHSEKCRTLNFGEKIKLNGFDLSIHNSGHILGSAQVLLEGEKTIAFTSDFKMQDSLIQKKAEVLHADTVVIESTFGLPCHEFPEREKIYETMGAWIKEKSKNGFVVLGGYAVGKGQELTAIVNEYAGTAPLVHEAIYNNNKIYEKNNVDLGDYTLLNHNLKDSPVLIMPPSLINHNMLQVLSFSTKKRIFSAFATGWSYRKSYDAIFPLSDHADFNQLMGYVQESNPKQVFTTHGYAKELAHYIQKRLKIPAKPLCDAQQKCITDY